MDFRHLYHGFILLIAVTATSLAAGDYTLHEWGTFTTVIGSDGTHLDGVEREDAPLPSFVYQLDSPNANVRRLTKGLDYRREFARVNVRLETPVIYFYTDQAFDVQVDVGFESGTIGQWFPDRSAGEARPRTRLLDFAEPRRGSIRWNVHVEPAGEDQSARVFRAGELPCWLYPRQPDSALVTNAQGETEKYLFYRGLGRMELPVTFTTSDNELTAANLGNEDIAHWLVFDLNDNHQARWWSPDSLQSATGAATPNSVTVTLTSQSYRPDWKQSLYADGLKMLMSAGLYRKEADAMLQTWWTSYFETPGLRVFWIVPNTTVDAVLPLEVAPAPTDVVRVIVGRSEILTPRFERRLVSDFIAASGNENDNRWARDRFFPAYSARVNQVIGAAATKRQAIERQLAKQATWNDRISSAKLQPNVQILAFEHAGFGGRRLVLHGAGVDENADGKYPIFLNMTRGLQTPATWNDRISSIKVIYANSTGADEAKPDEFADRLGAILFENSNYEAASLRLTVGTEIRDLSELSRQTTHLDPALVEANRVGSVGAVR